jgi:site-specific DNA-methyltransferase (adenine-specific)
MTVQVIHADICEALPSLMQLPIACVFADPPYSAEVHRKAVSTGTKGTPRPRDLGFGSLTAATREAVSALITHATRWSLVFSDIESSLAWEPKGVERIRMIPWIRWSQPQISGDRPPTGAEMTVLFHPPTKKSWNGHGGLTHFTEKSLRGEDKYSCEKPLDLMLTIVSAFSDVGDLVCDPCCGSGTTGVACALLGRHCVMLDSSETACQLAQERVQSGLSDRDKARLSRWIEEMSWAIDTPDSKAGALRYARAKADRDRAEGAM